MFTDSNKKIPKRQDSFIYQRFFYYLDGATLHSQYQQHYGPEFYPPGPYPIYPEHEQEEYFASQIHVNRIVLILSK